MFSALGWIFLAASSSPESAPLISAQAYAHHLQAAWAEIEGDVVEARRGVALARLYDEGSEGLAKADARLAYLVGGAPSEPLPSASPELALWRAAAAGDWERVRRGLSRRLDEGAPRADDVALVLALAEVGYRDDAAALSARWVAPGRRLPQGWPSILDSAGWAAWAAVDPRPEVEAGALRAAWRSGAWARVESAVLDRLRVHPGDLIRIEAALRWAGAFDRGLAERLAERWRWLAPETGDARAEALLAGGWTDLASAHAESPAVQLRVDLAAGRWARAASQWRTSLPLELGLELARALEEAGRAAAARRVLVGIQTDEAFVLRARLSNPETRRRLLASAELRPERWGAWALLEGAEMPSDWTPAERTRAAWSARGSGPPAPQLVEDILGLEPGNLEALAWAALRRGGPWLSRARRIDPSHPRVLRAELRWTQKPARWLDWAIRRHPLDPELVAAARAHLGPRAEAPKP
ncbi:MAG: hypothetical protein AAGD10_05575 [Myxococcota bacterium]